MSSGPDLNPHNLLNIVLHHLEVPVAFVPGSLLFGGAAWWLARRRGWAPVPAVLAGCGLALALSLTVVRPFGRYPAGWLNPLATVRLCQVGSLSLAHLYEQLNVAMLVPFALCATLATRRPLAVVASCVILSAVVEFVQGATGGGECQLRDLVHNTLGAVLGVLLAVAGRWLRTRKHPRGHPRGDHGLTAGLGAGSGSSH